MNLSDGIMLGLAYGRMLKLAKAHLLQREETMEIQGHGLEAGHLDLRCALKSSWLRDLGYIVQSCILQAHHL